MKLINEIVCGLYCHDRSSEQILLHTATANDAVFRSIETIGPIKNVHYAAALKK